MEVLTAGFPCQDISGIGRRAGIQEGNRSGLWFDVARAVRALRPRLLVVENVAAIRYPGRGLDVVLGELAQAGYDAWWRCLRAADVGAPHYRERLFLLARPHTDTRQRRRARRGRCGGALLPTPIAGDTRPGAAPAERRRRGQRPQLSDAVTLIPVTRFSAVRSTPRPGPQPRAV